MAGWWRELNPSGQIERTCVEPRPLQLAPDGSLITAYMCNTRFPDTQSGVSSEGPVDS